LQRQSASADGQGSKFKSLKGKIGITVSIGVATFPHENISNHDKLISAADDALL